MADLKFNVKLKEKIVLLTGKDNSEKKFKLKELSGTQRKEWNKNYDYKVEVVDGKTTTTLGDNFKMPSATDFLSLCFYDEEDILIKSTVIDTYPNSMLEELYLEALKLSGMDPASVEKAKNELEGNTGSGSG